MEIDTTVNDYFKNKINYNMIVIGITLFYYFSDHIIIILMTVRKIIVLLLFSLIISGNLFSQKVFRDGYIIKNSGESVSGLIGFSPDGKIPSTCNFKRFDIAQLITYGPAQLKAFGYENGKRYESLEIDGKISYYETLLKGELSVYSKGSRYYLKKGDLPPAEVRDGKNSWSVEGTQKEFSSLTELIKYITEGTKVDIADALVLKKDLIPVVSAYNRESGKPWTEFNRSYSEKEISLLAWKSGVNQNRVGIIGGINNYILKITPEDEGDFVPDPDCETGLMFGLSFERVISKKSDRLSFRSDLIYLHQNFYSYGERSVPEIRYFTDDVYFEFSAFKLPLFLQYSFTGNRVVPYLNGGISGMFLIGKKYLHVTDIRNYGDDDIFTLEDSYMNLNFFELTAALGAGMKIRITGNTILNIEGRFEFGKGIFNNSTTDNISFKQYSLQPSILIGVNF
jgi:hypothetical protein